MIMRPIRNNKVKVVLTDRIEITLSEDDLSILADYALARRVRMGKTMIDFMLLGLHKELDMIRGKTDGSSATAFQ